MFSNRLNILTNLKGQGIGILLNASWKMDDPVQFRFQNSEESAKNFLLGTIYGVRNPMIIPS
jgi:hypothetical protein